MFPRIAMLSMHTSPVAALGGKETGGMNVYIRELCRQLAKMGWQVDVFTRKQHPDTPRVQQIEPGFQVINIEAGPAQALDRRSISNLVPEYVRGILAYAKEEELAYALIHSHYWLSGLAAQALRGAWQVPFVHMFHTLGRMKDKVNQDPAQGEASERADIEQRIMAWADRIVAATPLDRQQMLELYELDEAKVCVIPCGVNLELFRPIARGQARYTLGIPDERRLLLFVGRLDPVKGLNVLLEAMCILTRRIHPCHARDLSLAVIGGDRESHLEALKNDLTCLDEVYHELGLDDLIVFIGSQQQEMLPYYYAAAEVCVMPSLYESFGMVALEAMACGTPVIASRVGGLTYTVRDGETGFLVPEKNPEALADKLELVLGSDCLRHRLSHRAIQVAHNYGWDIVADDIIDMYGELGIIREPSPMSLGPMPLAQLPSPQATTRR